MKKYVLPIALLLSITACTKKVQVTMQTAQRGCEVAETPLYELADTLVVNTVPEIRIIDSFVLDTSAIIFLDIIWVLPEFQNPCHTYSGYCNDYSCRCCHPIFVPWRPPYPYEYKWDFSTLIIAFTPPQDTCLPDPEVTFFEPSAGMLLHLKVWQDVTGILHRPIVADLCRQAGFTFIGDIV